MEPSDALAVVLVLRADEPARFERAIVRWRALLCHEARGLGASEAQLMLAALQALCGPAAGPAACWRSFGPVTLGPRCEYLAAARRPTWP
jgi:hypothetical protein